MSDIKSIAVSTRQTTALATQYLGQKDFDNVKYCLTENGKLTQTHLGLRTSLLGYEIHSGVFLPISPGDWVITPDAPGASAHILSDAEFRKYYNME